MVEERYDCKKLLLFFFKTFRIHEKQKLLSEEDYVFFIDSTSIKVSPAANKNKKNQKQSIGCSKGDLTTKLHLCCNLCVQWFFVCRLSTLTIFMKKETYIPKIIIVF